MRVRGWLVTGIVTGSMAILWAGMGSWGPDGGWTRSAGGAPPPLVVNKDTPLLLGDAPAEKPKDEAGADNSACYVCHTNYEEEEFVLWHAKEDVGCIDCHGKSYAHRNDEDNVTPPDKMYALEDIDKECCRDCHDEHNAPAAEVIARWQERCPAKTDPATVVCTDCHGRHRLAFRTVWWNKKTGELIVRQQGELIKRAEDLKKTPAEDAADAAQPTRSE